MENVLKYFKYFMLFSLPILFFAACDRSATDPIPEEVSGTGWAVGLMDDNMITILHTDNGGQDWIKQTQLCTGFTDFQGISAVSDEVAWAVGGKANGYGVVIRTRDKGEGWCRVGKSDDIPDVTLYAIKAYDENLAWVAGENSTVMHTLDGGLTWLKPDMSAIPLTTFYAVTQSANMLWLAGTAGEEGVIMNSSDGGNTWVRQGVGTVTGPLKDIQALSQQVIYASGPYKVWLSKDGGNTWNEILDLNGIQISDMCASNETNIWLATAGNQVMHSSDQGEKWETISAPVTDAAFSGITANKQGKIWIAGQRTSKSSVILYSSDDGKTWGTGNNDAMATLTRISFVSGVK